MTKVDSHTEHTGVADKAKAVAAKAVEAFNDAKTAVASKAADVHRDVIAPAIASAQSSSDPATSASRAADDRRDYVASPAKKAVDAPVPAPLVAAPMVDASGLRKPAEADPKMNVGETGRGGYNAVPASSDMAAPVQAAPAVTATPIQSPVVAAPDSTTAAVPAPAAVPTAAAPSVVSAPLADSTKPASTS